MEKRPSQFGVWALLVLTGAAAVCFAVLRLPLNATAKIVLVELIVLAFFFWAVRGRTPLDPRLTRMLPFVIFAPLFFFGIWSYIQKRTQPLLVFDCIFGVLTLLFLIPGIWYTIGAVRYGIAVARR